MAAAMISDRGLRKKLGQEATREAERPAAKKASKRKSSGSHAAAKGRAAHEQNNNQSKRPKFVRTGDGKADLLAAYQPWVVRTYGDLAKTKTITLRKYARILRTLRGEECNGSDSSKFRFWVKAKGFHLGKPPGYDAKPADGIVCRHSVLDAEEGPEAVDRCSGSADDPALYIPTAPVKNSSCQDPIYRKVAIVENFFDIIYTVHVDLEGRAGKHAGQKRTYRTITETYAFLPREAVTRFLMGCTDCQRRPRSLSPSSVLPTPSPSPTPLPSTVVPNGFHQLPPSLPLKSTDPHHPTKNGIPDIVTKNWENEIDASQHSIKSTYKDGMQTFDSPEVSRPRSYADTDVYSINNEINGVDLSSKNLSVNFNGIPNYHSSPTSNKFESPISAFRSVRKELSYGYAKEESSDSTSHNERHRSHLPDANNFSKAFRAESEDSCKSSSSNKHKHGKNAHAEETDDGASIKSDAKPTDTPKSRHRSKNSDKPKPKPYNPLDVCNLTSKDPPKSRSSPKRRHLNPIYSPSEHRNSVDSKSFPKPWSPSMHSMFSPQRLSTDSSGSSHYFGKGHFMDMEIDYSVPITTTYLKHMRNIGVNQDGSIKYEKKETLNQDPSDIDRDDDQYSGIHMKDADKLKLMLLAWNIHTQNRGRNGEAMDTVSGETNMADLWASYHSALGLAGGRPPTRSMRDQPSPVMLGSGSVDPGGNHDETSSSAGNGKEDEDALGSDDESDDRLDPQQHDPERLKAFNMFVRLFVDENLDRIVPISKQPKEKIQAIIDSCTRQFPEFAERARKRIRTYLKSCRRNKKVRGDLPTGTTTAPTWDATIRPTPAHLTSVQAEQILAQACENESHNAKRMRLGLEPVSQPMPTSTPGIAIDTTASSAPVTHPLLGLYNSSVAAAQLQGASPGLSSKDPSNASLPSLLSASIQSSLENGICLNNNNISKGQNDLSCGKNTSSRTSTPSVPGSLGDFSSSLVGSVTGPGSGLVGGAGALLSSLGAPPPAAMAAYQSALFSAMAAGAHHTQGLNFGGLGVASLTGNGPTDLSMKNSSSSLSQASFPSSLTSTNAVAALGLNSSGGLSHGSQSSSKPLLLSHKLNTAEMAAVRQLITGYRESAAFLLRSADELETLLLQQP